MAALGALVGVFASPLALGFKRGDQLGQLAK